MDASAAWLLQTNNGGLVAAWLDPAGARAVYAGDPDAIVGGTLVPRGQALAVPGGHRISGCWPFASGVEHCAWMAVAAVVVDGGGQPALRPGGAPRSAPASSPPEPTPSWTPGPPAASGAPAATTSSSGTSSSPATGPASWTAAPRRGTPGPCTPSPPGAWDRPPSPPSASAPARRRRRPDRPDPGRAGGSAAGAAPGAAAARAGGAARPGGAGRGPARRRPGLLARLRRRRLADRPRRAPRRRACSGPASASPPPTPGRARCRWSIWRRAPPGAPPCTPPARWSGPSATSTPPCHHFNLQPWTYEAAGRVLLGLPASGPPL